MYSPSHARDPDPGSNETMSSKIHRESKKPVITTDLTAVAPHTWSALMTASYSDELEGRTTDLTTLMRKEREK